MRERERENAAVGMHYFCIEIFRFIFPLHVCHHPTTTAHSNVGPVSIGSCPSEVFFISFITIIIVFTLVFTLFFTFYWANEKTDTIRLSHQGINSSQNVAPTLINHRSDGVSSCCRRQDLGHFMMEPLGPAVSSKQLTVGPLIMI